MKHCLKKSSQIQSSVFYLEFVSSVLSVFGLDGGGGSLITYVVSSSCDTTDCNPIPDLVQAVIPFFFTWCSVISLGFPDSSIGKESTCNAGDPGSIPGLWRSTGEGIGYPLQYSWVSFVVQLVKNPSEIQETWVQSLGWEDSLEKRKTIHSSILTWRIKSMGLQRVRPDWETFTFTWHIPAKTPSQGNSGSLLSKQILYSSSLIFLYSTIALLLFSITFSMEKVLCTMP